MHACVRVSLSMLTLCDTAFTMCVSVCVCVFVDVATSTCKLLATAKVFFSSYVTILSLPFPFLLPFFSPPKGE